jgi:uncharacterized protein (TIGR02594 family)
MTKNVSALLFLLGLILAQHDGHAQTVVVGEKEAAQYEQVSYRATSHVTLKPGFSFVPNDPAHGKAEFSAAAISNTEAGTAGGKKSQVITETLTQAGYKTNAAVDAAPHPAKKTVIAYLDGLGRPLQQVAQRQSADGAGRDVVQLSQYDRYGRQAKAFLPYVSAGTDGGFRPDAPQEQAAWYQSAVGDAAAYAQTVFEASPLQRVKEQGAPGADWQPGTGHTVRAGFRTNLTADYVSIFNETGRTAAYYAESELAVAEGTDENGNQVLTFTDKLGRQVLKRVQLDEAVKLEGYADPVSTPWLETYSVYDDYGSLRYMVPPKAVELLKKGKTWAEVQGLLFTYAYDPRGRLAEKKVPGSEKTVYKYDNQDRPVLVQDANLRAKNANSWYYTKYDRAKRPVMEGIYTFASGAYQTVDEALLAQTVYHEERNTSSTNHFYTNQAFPTTDTTPLSVTYYDDYANYTAATYTAGLLVGQEAAATANTFGTVTGKKTRVVASTGVSGTWLQQVYFYDALGRLIQARGNNHLYNTAGLEDVAATVYDFVGNVTSTQSTVKSSATSSLTVENVLEYEANSGLTRRVKQRNKLNGGAWDKEGYQLVADYTYDGLGRLLDKKLHEKAAGSNTFLQSVDYRYNIRGWLTSINHLSDDAAEGDAFRMRLLYHTADAGLGNTARFNGSITALTWQVNANGATGKQRSYKFTYDKVDRLRHAHYAAWGGSSWTEEVGGYDEKDISYDHNGNIWSLKRNTVNSGTTAATPIDELTYSLTGNLLTQVEDAAGNAQGFHNRSVGQANELAYNAAGSLSKDLNKNITAISYNELNKVSQITFADGKTIAYDYDASGNRLSTAASGITKKHYLGGAVVEGTAFQFFAMAEGRVRVSGGSFVYEYFLKDHQGNVRLSLEDNAGQARVVQENHYYPFGAAMQGAVNSIAVPTMPNRELYNGGSEWQNQFGDEPNFHSTFFREYDPVLGRFNGVDPAADRFAGWSPYNYAFNDPVNLNDPSGAYPPEVQADMAATASASSGGGGWGGMVMTSRGPMSASALGGYGRGLNWAAGYRSEEANRNLLSPYNYMSHYGVSHQQYADIKYGRKDQPNNQNSSGDAFTRVYNAIARATGAPTVALPIVDVINGKAEVPWWWGDTQLFLNSDQNNGLDGGLPWMDAAKSQLGTKEILGSKHNPAIIGFHATTGGFKNDETPWCSSFVNWSLNQVGIQGTNSAKALSWKGWGQNLGKPAFGSIAVIDYGGGRGHVGFVAGISESGSIILLGGNQSDMVKYSAFSPNIISSYRFPAGFSPSFILPRLDIKGKTTFNSTR